MVTLSSRNGRHGNVVIVNVKKDAAAAPRAATLHQVAQAAGVSLITASRALAKPDKVAAATLQRVREAAAALGYVPNLMAGGLKAQRSRTVAALVPVISVPQFLPTVQALTETLDAAGYQLVLGQTGYDRSREHALLQTLIGRRVDGIVVAGLLGATADAEGIRRLGIPVVETWDLGPQPLDMLVGFSHAQAGAAVARFFLARRWRRLGLVSADDERARQRVQGFCEAAGADLPVAWVPAPATVASGRAGLAELLAREPRLRAVHCSSDLVAMGVLTEARARGLRVPQDLAVCGFGDADFSVALEPALSTVHIAAAEIGRQAAQMILQRCQGQAVAQPVVDVGFEIVERASTAIKPRSP
jgi:LacI family gluconate utilization system Gnt-I transcriptional repressor